MTPAERSLVILVAIMILYITELIPLAVTAVGSCAAAVLFGVVPNKVAWGGLSSDTNLLIAGMVVVGLTLFETGLAERIGKSIVGIAGDSEFRIMTALMLVTMVLSGFLNNTSTTATMMPVLAGIIATSGGKLHEKFTMMPLAIAAVCGGMLTLVGSTPTVIVQGIHVAAGLEPFGFFEFAIIGAPICVAFIIYNFTLGRWLSRKMYGANPQRSEYMANMMKDMVADGADAEAAPAKDPKKQVIAALILMACVAGFVLADKDRFPLGTIAMTGALVCVITGCIGEKSVYRQMDWTTVLVLGGSIGFAAALDKSGGGKLLADTVLGLVGNAITPFILMCLIAGLGVILTQFMSNTAATAMLAPVGIAMAQGLGVDPIPVGMALAMTSSASFSTPVATPPMTLVLGPGGYRFFDYIKWGGLFNIISYFIVILLVPIFWPFGG